MKASIVVFKTEIVGIQSIKDLWNKKIRNFQNSSLKSSVRSVKIKKKLYTWVYIYIKGIVQN